MLLRPKETYIDNDYCDTKDIYYIAYNSFYHDHKALFHVMNLQQKYICKPSFTKRPVCVLFYYTDITCEVMKEFLDQMEKCEGHLEKVAVVGVPVNARVWYRLKARRRNSEIAPYQFFSNGKEALQWLNQA